MVVLSEDITIKIGGTDYSTDIYEFTESGGDRQYTTVICGGNKTKRIEISKSPYEVTLKFKHDSNTFAALKDISTPVAIDIYDATGSSTFSTTYSNMLPTSYNIEPEVDSFLGGSITYTAPPYNSSGVDNRVFN